MGVCICISKVGKNGDNTFLMEFAKLIKKRKIAVECWVYESDDDYFRREVSAIS